MNYTKTKILIITILTLSMVFLSSCKDEDGAAFFPVMPGEEPTPTAVDNVTSNSGTTVVEESSDEPDNGTFAFETSNQVGLNISVSDNNGPVSGALIVFEQDGTILFQGVTDESGIVTGNIEVEGANTVVGLTVLAGSDNVNASIDTEGIAVINRNYTFESDAGSSNPPVADTDSDGVPDNSDAYPEDPDRATVTLKPGSGESVVAFEDLFPNPGDADFNDYVVKVRNEEDLNANGKVVRIRGRYDHIAKGAGYNHFLRINLPGSGNVNLKRYDANGNLESETNQYYPALTGIEVMDRSDRTISQSNTASGQVFQTGKYAEIEVIFDAPIETSQLGAAPYDLYIFIVNTNKEVHFPGRYYNESGEDLYMDSNGFPWALRIPEAWNWPYERENISNGYPAFESWYLSMGTTDRDWYLSSEPAYVFPYITDGALAAYVRAGFRDSSFLWTMLAMAIAGLTVLFLYRKRAESGL